MKGLFEIWRQFALEMESDWNFTANRINNSTEIETEWWKIPNTNLETNLNGNGNNQIRDWFKMKENISEN